MFEITWTWWVLLAVPLAWFFQLCIHEASHLLLGLLFDDMKPLGFYPYPHVKDGKFYFARYRARRPPGYDNAQPYRVRHLAPFLAATVVMGLCVGLWFIVGVAGRIWLLPFMAAALVDALWFWRGVLWGSASSDGKRWRYGEKGRL